MDMICIFSAALLASFAAGCAGAMTSMDGLFRFPSNGSLQNPGTRFSGFVSDTAAVVDEEECLLQCLLRPQCVSVSVSDSAAGSRLCEMNRALVTLQKFLNPAPGFSYYYMQGPENAVPLGCFSHSDRTVFDYIDNPYRLGLNTWVAADFAQMVEGCGTIAWRRGYSIYAVEFWGVCWGLPSGADYLDVGPPGVDDDGKGCIHGVGSVNHMYIYQFV